MQLKVASYNIHKAVGRDGRRDPERIVAVLREVDADVIALQEVDRRFGRREAVIPRALLDEHSPWLALAPKGLPASMGWHGNAILVRRGIDIADLLPIALPTLEPRGAICAELKIGGGILHVVGMHLDLSGLRRRHQIEAVTAHVAARGGGPAVLMGDLNEWATRGGTLRAFGHGFRVLAPGRSFPSVRPVAQLDRIVASDHWTVDGCGVHHSERASVASDHLPVWAKLRVEG